MLNEPAFREEVTEMKKDSPNFFIGGKYNKIHNERTYQVEPSKPEEISKGWLPR